MLKLYYLHKPYFISQAWGNPDSAYEQFGFSRHNGIDAYVLYSGKQPKTWPVYCPVEGFRVYKVQWSPNGGGNEIYLMSKEKVQMGDKLCYAYLVIFHADKVLVNVGYEPALGEIITVADSTGFSTGPHTHMGLYRIDYNGSKITWLDTNDANSSCNPADYFTKEYAVDKASTATLIKSGLRYYSYILGLKK